MCFRCKILWYLNLAGLKPTMKTTELNRTQRLPEKDIPCDDAAAELEAVGEGGGAGDDLHCDWDRWGQSGLTS
jgi:hypothetical protein